MSKPVRMFGSGQSYCENQILGSFQTVLTKEAWTYQHQNLVA